MLRTVGDQPTLWGTLLPPQALVMPAELVRVDALLNDERFFAPYREFFHASLGRPSIPIEHPAGCVAVDVSASVSNAGSAATPLRGLLRLDQGRTR